MIALLGTSSLLASVCPRGPGPQVVCQPLLEGWGEPTVPGESECEPRATPGSLSLPSFRGGNSCRGRRRGRRGEAEETGP